MKTAIAQSENKQNKSIDRRKNTDLWSYAKTIVAVLSWCCFLFALIMSYYAAPESNYGVLRYYDIEVRQFWLTPLTGYLYILLWLSAVGSYLALLIDKYRGRRQVDTPHYNLIFLLTINIIWLMVILYHFHK